MKKLLLPILLISLTVPFANGQNTVYDTIRYARKYYEKRIAQFKSEPVVKGSVVFLGNSITEYGDWKKLLVDTTVVNRGVAADNTFGVLDRLEDVIAFQPKKLFIEIGINDISQNIPNEIIVRNILSIVERVTVRSPDTKIYVHSILPTNDNVKKEYPDAYNKNSQINLVNQRLKQEAKKDRFIYIDLNKELSDQDGKLDVNYAESDGLHLNEAGYQVWINLLKTNKWI